MTFDAKIYLYQMVGAPLCCKTKEESPGSLKAGCWLMASGGDPRESATENIPPQGKGEMVR